MLRKRPPMGVILAGGLGRRIGGSKAVVQLAGQPLISYPLEAVRTALSDVAVIAKADTQLPSLPGVTVWVEPESPRHPVVGIVQALALAEGRSVVVCASDLPFVTPELIYRLATADLGKSPAVVACCGTDVQPLLGCYAPRAIDPLRNGLPAEAPVRELVASLHPRMLEVGDPELLFNINSPEDLLHAAAILDGRARASRPPASRT
ncbi:MAG TPA: molybdenum cofactor guanylyltransferase [Solirubrobacteraceae bacterium]|nr:molybdenum cofactor guanylyltransferase [Solirubrobacteraceae bacterium]